MQNYKGLMLTDLDGTFLNETGKINMENIEALKLLGKHKVARAACTGRTLNSAREVVARNLPFDFLVFSSGAGICNFADDKVICRHEITQPEIKELAEFFRNKNLDFSIHFPIPENHRFYWYSGKVMTPDLVSRLHYLAEFAVKGSDKECLGMQSATQFLAICPDLRINETIEEARNLFSNLSFIRATSPLNEGYSWIEVFPANINKGSGGDWLCKTFDIPLNKTMSIGNDYNDIHMLEWAETPFIMANSPDELKKRFNVVPSNSENGFAVAVKQWLSSIAGDKA